MQPLPRAQNTAPSYPELLAWWVGMIMICFIIVTKYPIKEIKEGWVYFGSELKAMGMSLWWGLQAAGHKASMVRRQGAEMLVLSLISPFYPVQEPKSWNCATHI